MKEVFKIFKCNKCENILFSENENVVKCCDETLTPLVANTTDASLEKHVPVIEKIDGEIIVRVGSIEHPMEKEHYITGIIQVSDSKLNYAKLYPEQSTETRLPYIPNSTIYALCNKHGLWSTKLD